jgi:hypothetical protein
MHRRIHVAAVLLLAVACAACPGESRRTLRLAFLDDVARSAVSKLIVWVLPADRQSCQPLIDGEANPADLAFLDRVELDNPPAPGSRAAQVPSGAVLLLAEGFSQERVAIVRGCREIKNAGSADVTLYLDWVCGPLPGSEITGNQWDDDCDGLTDECRIDPDCSDGLGCTVDSCVDTGCTHATAPDGTSCDDNFCMRDQTCTGGVCGGGTPRDCDDDEDCTADSCNEETDACENTLTPLPGVLEICADGLDQNCDGIPDGCCLGDGTFAAKTDFPCGAGPFHIASADFNQDGILDLAAANYDTGAGSDLNVLLGNVDGSFGTPVAYPTGGAPFHVLAADLDGNGLPDLVAANSADGTVSVLLGRGDGTFAPKTDSPVGATPRCVHSHDFNSDNIPDLLTTNTSDDTVTVLLGNGDGTFTPGVDYPAGAAPVGTACGDFDADGIADLAVAARDSGAVVLFGGGSNGRGDGTFGAASVYPAGDEPRGVVAADFDLDGILDLALANSTSSDLAVLLGRGDGTFAAAVIYPAGAAANFIASGELNADGIIDLVVSNFDADTLCVFLGAGDGTFAACAEYATGVQPRGTVVGDFTGDNIADIAVGNHTDGTVSVLPGRGSGSRADGTFGSRADFTAGLEPLDVVSGDFNRDRIADLAVANSQSDTLSVLLGNGGGGRGNGTFAGKVDYATGAVPHSVTAADFNADTLPDLAVTNHDSDTVSIFLGNGDGTFTTRVDYPAGSNPHAIRARDLDADAVVDLVVVNRTADTVSILLGNGSDGRGDGTFAAKMDFPVGDRPGDAALADFDADGNLDLAVPNLDSDDISVLLGNGDGTFGSPTSYPAGDEPCALAAVDLNADHRTDLAVANVLSNDVSVLLGNGDGTFGSGTRHAAGRGPQGISAADLNADGVLDLAVCNNLEHTLSVLFGNGNGTFSAQVAYPAGNGPRHIITGDFNSDKIPDLAVVNALDGTVSVLPGRGECLPSY